MNVEIFSLCDAATQQTGKLNILGAFDSVYAKKAPIVISQCALALRLRFSLSEQGEHSISVKFIDIDGKEIVPPIKGALTVNFNEGQVSVSQNLVLNIHGFKIDNPGQYSIRLVVDEHEISSLPLHIALRD